MADTFQRRTRDLIRKVGDGDITSNIRIDQVYAQVQHDAVEFKHPRGGQAFFLSMPLLKNHPKYLQVLAEGMFRHRTMDLMVDVVLQYHNDVLPKIPLFEGTLRNSMELTVDDAGTQVFKDGPVAKRLTKKARKAKTARWSKYGGWR
jgi:hypothetical protein